MMNKKDRYYYPAVFYYEDDGRISVSFPDFDFATCADNEVEAFLAARECLGANIYDYEEDERELPVPTELSCVALDESSRAVLIDVFMPSIRMATVNHSVNRTVTLPAGLNAAAMERNINFSQVLQEALRKMIYGDNNSY